MFKENNSLASGMKMFILFSAMLLFSLCFEGISSCFAEKLNRGNNQRPPTNALFRDIIYTEDLLARKEAEKLDPTIIRSNYVRINVDYIAGEEVPEGKEQIILNLFDDVSVKGEKERLERRNLSRYTWFGHIEGKEQSQIIMVVENLAMAANITVDGRMFQIRAIEGTVHAIYEINHEAFPDICSPIPVLGRRGYDMLPETPQADDASTIDVMVVYSDDTASASAGISSEIQLAIDETNQSYANSGIIQRLNLVHSAEVDYSETGSMNTDLDCITYVNDCLDQVHGWRDTYGADMVSFWVESGNYCGLAWLMTSVSESFAPYAFSVVDRGCATGYYSFGHEMGHNMGAHHDRDNASSEGAYSYSYGYQDPSENWRTVMAYNCSSGCARIQYWSNPDVLYGGVPMGVPEGDENEADNRKTLNNTASTVANFRQSPSCTDVDSDTYYLEEGCGTPVDCDDDDDVVHPDATELCDEKDNNCDGTIDESFPTPGVVTGFLFMVDKEGMSWNTGLLADRYDVLKGDLMTLRSSGGDFNLSLLSCLEENSTDIQSIDSIEAGPGEGFYYLIRAQANCKDGTYNTDQSSQTEDRDSEIESSLSGCS